MRRALLRRCILGCLCLSLLPGCAGRYFHNVDAALTPSVVHQLPAWPYAEYWTGIVFNGEKIGFTHLALIPQSTGEGLYEVQSEASLAFHFLGLKKTVRLTARDWVRDRLQLQRFAYEYDLDGHLLKLAGRVEGGQLLIERETGGQTGRETIPLAEPLYPTSAIALYPSLHGLEIGKQYAYLVYEGQRQALARVSQVINAYQESELYPGRAFRVETSLDGERSTLWINERGEPVLEMAWHGLLIAALETEKQARAYLAVASLNKREVLVEYSRIRPNILLPQPRTVTSLSVAIRGVPAALPLPSDHWQQCGPASDKSQPEGVVHCVIQASRAGEEAMTGKAAASGEELQQYLRPSPVVQSQDPQTQILARDIVGPLTEALPRIQRLVAWIQEHLEQAPVDVFSSLDVLQGRKAECQGLTWLYAALARSLGIPTRVVNGLVYSSELEGFLYHTWAESHVGSGWLAIDPTFGQRRADATHIKLVEGERLADLLSLVEVVGKIHLEILSFQTS